MERMTGGRIGSTGADNLIAKLSPPPDSFIIELKTPGAYARGTVLSLEDDGTYEVMGKGGGKASCVLADPTLEDDATAVAYRGGHFNRKALIVGDEYELSAEDENDLRLAGIFLSDMLSVAEDRDDGAAQAYAMSGQAAVPAAAAAYTGDELGGMTVKQIRDLAAERGYEITKTGKDDVIAEFLAAQGKEEKENG